MGGDLRLGSVCEIARAYASLLIRCRLMRESIVDDNSWASHFLDNDISRIRTFEQQLIFNSEYGDWLSGCVKWNNICTAEECQYLEEKVIYGYACICVPLLYLKAMREDEIDLNRRRSARFCHRGFLKVVVSTKNFEEIKVNVSQYFHSNRDVVRREYIFSNWEELLYSCFY